MRHATLFFVAALGAASLGPVGISGQEEPQDSVPAEDEAVSVWGSVTDVVSGRAVVAASIRLIDLERGDSVAWQGLSEDDGVFDGPRLGPSTYRIDVSALGYRALTHVTTLSGFGTAEIRIELTPEALEVEPLVVVTRRRSRLERNGFYDRREWGFGYALDREEIEARRFHRVSDLMRRVPGMRVSVDGLGRSGALQMRGGCSPDVVLDGVRLVGSARLDEIIHVQDLEAVEVYGSAGAPIQYSRSACGVVLLWTRDPGQRDGRPFSWKRLGVAAGLIGIGFILAR